MNVNIHDAFLITEGIDDAETLAFWRDLHCVMNSVLQSMSIVGPWMEARTKHMLRWWLPEGEGWTLSGPAQVFVAERSMLRSRSWDIVVHRELQPNSPIPPQASPESGVPLLPAESVAAVIDTKTNFSDPSGYAAQPVFNLANDATEPQLEFLGGDIAKIILAASSSSRSPDSMYDAGLECGVLAFSLARYVAGPVSDGVNRVSGWKLERFVDGTYPMQRFKTAVLDAVSAHRSNS